MRKLQKKNVSTRPPEEITGAVIIDKGREDIRIKIRRFFFKTLKRKEIEVIYLQNFKTESEFEAFLVRQAINEVVRSVVFSDELLDLIIAYIAYKYSSNNIIPVSEKTKEKLERDFFQKERADCISYLDSQKLDDELVLNPPPKEKPFLETNLFPLVGILTNQIKQEQNLEERSKKIQRAREFVEKLISLLCERKIKILWIGRKETKNYEKLIKPVIKKESLLIGARGSYIDILNYLCSNRLEKYLSATKNVFSVEGTWWYSGKMIKWKWIFIEAEEGTQ